MDGVDTVLFESPSPDGEQVTTVFERDCGATTAKNTQASLRYRNQPFNSKQQRSFFIAEGNDEIGLLWLNPRKLVVRVPQSSKVFRKEENAGGVSIIYELRNGVAH